MFSESAVGRSEPRTQAADTEGDKGHRRVRVSRSPKLGSGMGSLAGCTGLCETETRLTAESGRGLHGVSGRTRAKGKDRGAGP